MADERDFELLDDYFTNRMSDQDRSAFEQKLNADPDLQHEYALQKRLIQGIKDARVAELKSMLNNVAVPSAGTGGSVALKIIIGTVVTVIIAGAAYWFSREDQSDNASSEIKTEENIPSAQPSEMQAIPETKNKGQKPTSDQQQVVETDKNQTSAGTEHSKPSLAKKPDPLLAPGEKKKSELETIESTIDENDLLPAPLSLSVETDRANSRYTFHYQFRDGKLFLYGPFEKNQYEIMEFSANDKRVVFLYYKDQFYSLPEANDEIKPLSVVTDGSLLKKLGEYQRSK